MRYLSLYYSWLSNMGTTACRGTGPLWATHVVDGVQAISSQRTHFMPMFVRR